jgi:predicted Ser/Thr protein kinase
MPDNPSHELIALQHAVAGRYSVERELGRGGMGIVYLARDAALERPVAIKLLPPHLCGTVDMRERFVREARTAAKLSHPNIVPIHSVEEHGDIVFFVMAFVDGETLTARVRRAGPLPAREASKIVQEMAWALAYAHSAGVIHRDVKPDNVLIDRATGRATLTDFGIARVAGTASLTGVGEVLGTAQFVSPEQASGSVVDGRSDLYSLGVTAFFALTGRLPFEATTVIALLGMHLTRPAPPIATVRAGLPSKLATAIDRCLAKDPADRFATGEQLGEAIADLRSGDVEVAPPVRAFLRDRVRAGYELAIYPTALWYLSIFADAPPSRTAGPLALLAAASVARLLRSARRLLHAGFGFEDVRAALVTDAAAREEELGPAPPKERAAAARLGRGGLVLVGAGLIAIGAMAKGVREAHDATSPRVTTGDPDYPILLMYAIVTLIVLVGLGGIVYSLHRLRSYASDLRSRPQPMRFAKLWAGRFGSWFFTLAGIGLAKSKVPATESTAHTEVLIAKAADDLLAALPPKVQAELGEGRRVIQRLEAHVARLREREAQLGSAIAQAGHGGPVLQSTADGAAAQALLVRRQSLTDELEQARREVAARRASGVAALENVRLQLLRLRVGLASTADLSAELTAAERLEQEISAMTIG